MKDEDIVIDPETIRQHVEEESMKFYASHMTPLVGYTVAPNMSWILCHRCGMTSYNANDIHKRYCGFCHEFHQR
jgi:ribosomal protein L37E